MGRPSKKNEIPAYTSDISKKSACTEAARMFVEIESLAPRDRELMYAVMEIMLITARGNDFKITEIRKA